MLIVESYWCYHSTKHFMYSRPSSRDEINIRQNHHITENAFSCRAFRALHRALFLVLVRLIPTLLGDGPR